MDWANPQASGTTGLPVKPAMLQLTPTNSLSVGIYLMAAPTGKGKTITSMALVAWCNFLGIPATYISCFEPRSPVVTNPLASTAAPFTNEMQFWSDAEGLMKGVSKVAGLVIYDSATLPLKAYSGANKSYANQATFPGGMQPSDRGFVDAGGKIALRHNLCIIINLNSTLVPYVDDLSGAAEGLINIIDAGTISYADRSPSSKRASIELSVPEVFINGALNYFDFGSYEKSSNSNWNNGYVGI
jgi:hypothetical protein